MTHNDASCFTKLRKAFFKWQFNGNTKVIEAKTDNNSDISDTKIQLLLYNDCNNASFSNNNNNNNAKADTVKVPISFHADMELSQSQSGATNDSKLLEQPNCSVNNNDKRRQEIEFKENKSVSIEIGSSGNKHTIRHESSESIGSTVVMEKRHKKGEDVNNLSTETEMDFNDTEQKSNNAQVPNLK